MILRPQAGPQEAFLSSAADIVIYGGAAGGGKTYGLLLEPTRYWNNPQFGSVIFRRLATQISGEGGLWDTAMTIYPRMGARPFLSPRYGFKFPRGMKLTFAHLQYELDVNAWQGSQIAMIGFDELTHFTEHQFFYMLSRNRSICGVRPYMRATCNPDVDSWVAQLIAWWIDQDTGLPIKERSGKVRYFTRIRGMLIWGDSYEEVLEQANFPSDMLDDDPSFLVKSITFIPSKLEDNPILMANDPGYRGSLLALPNVERQRLMDGNWKIRKQAGLMFPRTSVNVIDAVPTDVKSWVRRWDLAATEPSEANPSPDATASVLMGRRENGRYVVADGVHLRRPAYVVREVLRNVSAQDKQYGRVAIILPQDPGQAGKEQIASLISLLSGYKVKGVRETGPKDVRAEPLASQWQAGNVDIVRGQWNDDYINEMEAFPTSGQHDDYVDASSGAFLEVSNTSAYERYKALAS
jgi:predicted phage terminase large subunit-like protein